MVVFYIFSLLLSAATVLWLWQAERSRSPLAYVLYGFLIYDAIRLSLTLGGFLDSALLTALSQLLAWSVLLLVGIEMPWPAVAVLSLLATVLSFFFPEIGREALTWSFPAAIPLVTLIYLRSQPSLPIMAPRLVSSQRKMRPVIGQLSSEMIETQRPILECIADGVIVTQAGSVEYVNQAAATMIGIGADELIGQPAARVLALLPTRAGESGSQHPLIHSQFELNGRIVQYQMNIVYDEAGQVQGTVLVLRDVTDTQRAEKAKSTFLTTVSHELRTPLTAIKGYVEIMLSGAGGEVSAQQEQFLNIIQRNVSRMVHLIDGLIFVASVKGERFEFSDRQADIRRLTEQIAREMGQMVAAHNQQIEIEIDPDLKSIQADPIHISTILQELIGNAVKYNNPGGTVRIQAALATTDERDQDFAVVNVSDEGIGISREDRLHIFDDFYRPDRHDVEIQAGGIGVGLSIVRALVEAYNGRIWVESSNGQGSTFTFLIPVQRKEVQTAAEVIRTGEF